MTHALSERMSGESDRQVIGSPLQAGMCRSTAPVHGARYCRGIMIVKGYRDHAGIAAKARCKARRSSLGREGESNPSTGKEIAVDRAPGFCTNRLVSRKRRIQSQSSELQTELRWW